MIPRAKCIESRTAKKVSDDIKVANLIESNGIINGSNCSNLTGGINSKWNDIVTHLRADWISTSSKEYLGRRLLSIGETHGWRLYYIREIETGDICREKMQTEQIPISLYWILYYKASAIPIVFQMYRTYRKL